MEEVGEMYWRLRKREAELMTLAHQWVLGWYSTHLGEARCAPLTDRSRVVGIMREYADQAMVETGGRAPWEVLRNYEDALNKLEELIGPASK